MNTKVTIVMYHYVRDLKNSKFPDIKGLDVSLFESQLKYLIRHYNIITMEQMIDAINGMGLLPEKSVLLTFDDGYSDHYKYVFPILRKNNVQGSFYLPAKAIEENEVLDVNKIHFILAACRDKIRITNDLSDLLKVHKEKYSLNDYGYYYRKLAKQSRYDTAEVIFIKRLLQVELNEELRSKITNILFKKYVSTSESSFSQELYLNMEQIKIMLDSGMHFGSHGYEHIWLNTLSEVAQRHEIDKSLSFLSEIGCDLKTWTMCYPYGAFDKTLIKILEENKCQLALTTNVNVADISYENKYVLSRLDTNDLPTKMNTT